MKNPIYVLLLNHIQVCSAVVDATHKNFMCYTTILTLFFSCLLRDELWYKCISYHFNFPLNLQLKSFQQFFFKRSIRRWHWHMMPKTNVLLHAQNNKNVHNAAKRLNNFKFPSNDIFSWENINDNFVIWNDDYNTKLSTSLKNKRFLQYKIISAPVLVLPSHSINCNTRRPTSCYCTTPNRWSKNCNFPLYKDMAYVCIRLHFILCYYTEDTLSSLEFLCSHILLSFCCTHKIPLSIQNLIAISF